MRMAARNHTGRKSNKPARVKKSGFVRHTITIPADLEEYFISRKNSAEHAGNASGYARTLVIEERDRLAIKKFK